MKLNIELDWDTVDDLTVKSLKSHYDIVTDMIADPHRIVDLDYNIKLQNALAVILDYFGLDVENGDEVRTEEET